jgi:hypothetical protein
VHFFIVFLGLLAANNIYAGAYKCEIDGKIEYRQAPCPKQSTQTEVRIWKDTSTDYTERDRELMSKHQVGIGMTERALLASWGQPSEINRRGRGADQWIYDRGNYVKQFVYVEDGLVVNWSD